MTKEEVTTQLRRRASDSGGSEVQVALVTGRIVALQGSHFAVHPKDKHGRRGLTKLLSQRRKVLNHLQKSDAKRFQRLADVLGLSNDDSDSAVGWCVSVVGNYIKALRSGIRSGRQDDVGSDVLGNLTAPPVDAEPGV